MQIVQIVHTNSTKIVKCEFPDDLIVGKVGFLSAGGSIMDTIAKVMALAAKDNGELIPRKSIVKVEPTSGNTGA